MALSKSLTYLGHVCEPLVCEHTWSGGRDAGRLEPGACWHWPAPTTSRASWSNRPTTPTRRLIQVVVDLLMVHAGHPRPLFRSDPQAAVKIHLGSIIQAFKSISFFCFRTRSFAVVGLVSSKWNYFLDRLILSVWKGCEIVRCECAKTVFHSGSGRLTMNDESNIWLVSSTIKISFFQIFDVMMMKKDVNKKVCTAGTPELFH